jgi:hypothetical protein
MAGPPEAWWVWLCPSGPELAVEWFATDFSA